MVAVGAQTSRCQLSQHLSPPLLLVVKTGAWAAKITVHHESRDSEAHEFNYQSKFNFPRIASSSEFVNASFFELIWFWYSTHLNRHRKRHQFILFSIPTQSCINMCRRTINQRPGSPVYHHYHCQLHLLRLPQAYRYQDVYTAQAWFFALLETARSF